MEEKGSGAVTNALDAGFCDAVGMVCTYTTVGEILMLSVTIVLESFLIESAVIPSVSLDCDTMSSGNAFISMFGGEGGFSGRGGDEVDVNEVREVVEKENCSTKSGMS